MQKLLLIGLGAFSLLAADVAAAQAQQGPPPPPPGAPGGGPGFDHHGTGPGFGRGFGPGGRRFHRPSLEEIQKRNAERFAQMDANRDGKVTYEEFRQFIERRRTERQRQMFNRFSGGSDSFTLDQLNARAAERQGGRDRRGPDGGPGGGPGGPQPGQRAPR